MARGRRTKTSVGKNVVKSHYPSTEDLLVPWAADWDSFSAKTLDTVLNNIQNVNQTKLSRGIPELDCGETSALWFDVFKNADIPVRILAGYYHPQINRDGFVETTDGLLEPPLSADHVWLEVEGHLLDPTAGQFQSAEKPWSKENYYAHSFWDEDADADPQSAEGLLYKR